MAHSPGFLKMVEEARPRVREIEPREARRRVQADSGAVLLDVREDHEWRQGHVAGAVHLSKGILERDLEAKIPDPDCEILMYCGGGYRSVLAADSAQKMGYRNVASIQGGYKALVQQDWAIEREEP